MSQSISQIANTDLFQVWLDRTNQALAVISNNAITANSSVGTTTGNAYVTGTFGASVLVSPSFRGGNATASNTAVWTSNVQFNQGMTVYNTTFLNVNTATSGTSAQVIDSFKLATYRGGEYNIVVKNSVANGYQMSKMLVIQDGGDAYITEYGIVLSNASLGVFSVSANSTDVILSFTPVPTATTVQGTKQMIGV